ncbi:FapA family protein [Ferrimonas marina]|uniref:Flagellar Assembly Protein A N-terminal region domain-containing protein n=1 Tax=Ferrimonas marina TaxID=299255 RepID=A0A1M5VWG9_9GAMM|nr:FapA family protein [Ferrimonas marina]SHH79293.1 hypothetical protein SAMN02745129_3017 [Ferrimonas marina]
MPTPFWDAHAQQVLVQLRPADFPNLQPQQLQAWLQDSPFAHYRPLIEQWADALTDLANGDPQQIQSLALADKQDGDWQLLLSDNAMTLTAQRLPAQGGKEADKALLVTRLGQIGIRTGLIRSRIDALLADGTTPQLIAQGKAPCRGEDGFLERLVPLGHERVLRPQAQDNGKVDLRELGQQILVEPESALMRRHPPTLGQSGYNLYAESLKANPGTPCALQPGPGTRLAPGDPNLLVATLRGQPLMQAKGMTVEPTLTLEQVNTKSGNVHFDGAVVILGNVQEGMVVDASGSITVMGLVEGASLNAGGDLCIGQGVIGRPLDHGEFNCTLTAKGSIHVRYAHYTRIITGGDLHIEQQSLHCHLNCGGELVVGSSGRGDLVGGIAQAPYRIQAQGVGARAGAETRIELGQHLPQLRVQVEQQQQALNQAREQYQQVQERLRAPHDDSQTPALHQALKQLAQQRDELEQQLQSSQQRLQELPQRLALEITKILHPRVKLLLAEQASLSQSEHGPSRVRLSRGKVAIEPWVPGRAKQRSHGTKVAAF